MKFEFLLKNTKNLFLLNKNLLRTLEPKENVLNVNIKYWLKTNKLISLKKGEYILAEKFKEEKNKDKYLEYLAGKLVEPSYLSGEYILAKYQILSEPVQTITLVTTKTTKIIKNKLGVFRYYSISEKLFIGYEITFFNDICIGEATKSKALFDFLYFRFLKNKKPILEVIKNLRLNWENISKKDFLKAQSFLKFTNSQRLKKVFEIIKEQYYA